MNGLISVITPTYNRSEMLKQCIDSILSQTYKNFEIVIIDDCSNDDTEKLISTCYQDNRIKYYRNKSNMGPGYNRNLGYRRASGEFIVFMDDDDFYIDNYFFEKAIKAFQSSDGNLAFVAANASDYIIENNSMVKKYIGATGKVDGIEFLLGLETKYQKPLSTFSAIFHSKTLEDADFLHMEMVNDYAIYLRALLFGDAYLLDDHIGAYRKHSGNISLNISRSFLIKNLEERLWIKERLRKRITSRQLKNWWNTQMMLIFMYYLTKTNPEKEDVKYVCKWILEHSDDKLSIFIRMKIRRFIIEGKRVYKKMNVNKSR